MSEVLLVTVSDDDDGQRLDRWFRRAYPGLGHGRLEKLLRGGQIRVDGGRAKSSTRIEAGQTIRVPPLPADALAAPNRAGKKPTTSSTSDLTPAEREELENSVIYRDEAVIALNKPAGLAVQGGTGQEKHLDMMLDHLRFEAAERPRLVHRLDKDTSGLLLLARDARAARALAASFHDRATSKIYWALVCGQPTQQRGLIDLPISKAAGDDGLEKMSLDHATGQEAATLYQTVARKGRKVSWLLLMPLTGRTHQLRVHAALCDMPILGDGKYGGRPVSHERTGLPRGLMLHARELAIPHPEDGTTLRLQAAPPAAFLTALQRLDFDPAKEAGALHSLLDYKAAVEGWG